jgi:hypothetical protein
MKIKKNTFSTLVLELFFPSIANCRKLKIQKNSKIDFPYSPISLGYFFKLSSLGHPGNVHIVKYSNLVHIAKLSL